LDAGPMIALLHRKDRDHTRAVAGFQQLADGGAVLIAPLPIVFEVYKWLLYEAGPMAAQSGLRQMRASLEVLFPRQEEFEAAVALSGGLSNWAGTLEDAVVALAALSLRIPVWTLNYRDLGAFPRLRFWNPN
ncbi:MAG: type II toxin-antitoxin system VapC family toxin, partial [Armatimonadota bacterium]